MTKLHFAQMNSTQISFSFFLRAENIFRVQSRTQQDLSFPSTKLAVHQPLRPRATWRMLINRGESHVLVLGAPALGSLIPRLGGLSRGPPHLYQPLPNLSPPPPLWVPAPPLFGFQSHPAWRSSGQSGGGPAKGDGTRAGAEGRSLK